MAKELSFEDFEHLTQLFNMKPDYSFLEKEGNRYIIETWKSEHNIYLRLTRLIEFNKKNLELIDENSRKKLLTSMLNDAVVKENYEEAAELRDIILEF